MAALLTSYIADVGCMMPNKLDPCFEFVSGWIARATGKDARAAFMADGFVRPQLLQANRTLFMRRAQMIADRLNLAQSDGEGEGDVALLEVLAPGRTNHVAGAMAIRSRGLWFVRTARGVLAGPSPFIRAWAVPHG